MASGNRVDELESTVKELQATVNGLTDELVEAKVRIRELEDIVEDAGKMEAVEGMGGNQSQVESQQADQPQSAPQRESSDESPEQPASEPAEADTPKSEAPDETDNEESESSDIIIA